MTSLPWSPCLFTRRLSPACLLFALICFPSHASVLPLGSGETAPSPASRVLGAAGGEGGEERSCWAGSMKPVLTLKLCLGKIQQPSCVRRQELCVVGLCFGSPRRAGRGLLLAARILQPSIVPFGLESG